MKKKICLFLCFLLFTISLIFNINVSITLRNKSDNMNTVLTDISYLSSNYFKGRLTGTPENREVSKLIKNHLSNYGISPYKNTYEHPFNVDYPSVTPNHIPQLNVKDDKGNIVDSFSYGTDFKEDMLNFRKTSILFSHHSKITYTSNSIQVLSDGEPIIFYCPDSKDLNFRSSFSVTSSLDLVVFINYVTLNLLKDYINSGYYIYCSVPYFINSGIENNIIGEIPGKNPSLPPLVLSSHFDGVGNDLNNTIYPGALDNASGTALLLKLADTLSKYPKPDRTIIFAFYNSEEMGLIGSDYFAKENLKEFKNAININFDMVGAKDCPVSLIFSKKTNNTDKLSKEIIKILKFLDINYNIQYESSSDHASMASIGATSVTLCDDIPNIIHTPKDVVSNIDAYSLQKIYGVSIKTVTKFCYNKNLFVLYNSTFLVLSSFFSMLFLFLFIKSFFNKNKF